MYSFPNYFWEIYQRKNQKNEYTDTNTPVFILPIFDKQSIEIGKEKTYVWKHIAEFLSKKS